MQTTKNRHNMNRFLQLPVLALCVAAAGCSDALDPGNTNNSVATEGDEVEFLVANRDAETRTTYQEDWEETTSQNIYWGNYLTDKSAEQIRVFCRETVDANAAAYELKVDETNPSNKALSISKMVETQALHWGEKKPYDFYAFYPASRCGDNFVGASGYIINGSVDTQQSPQYYRAKVGTSADFVATTLFEIAENATQSTGNKTVIHAMPDMESAIMTAYTRVETEDYGNSVSLDFKVLADVLDITVNGPVTPNQLNGIDLEGRDNITVNSVLIKSSSLDQKLAGEFTLDMSTGTVTAGQNANNQIIVYFTDDQGLHPTLHVRSGAPELGNAPDVDQLRLRVFIMPGQVKDLGDLTITVGTNCGNYVQKLASHDMVSGAIHPIKLKYFQQRPEPLDFSNWIASLDPNIYLSELSIPGTWHSSNAASQGDKGIDLAEQYKAGIRAFEVHTKNGKTLYKDYNFEENNKLTADNATYSKTPHKTIYKAENNYNGGSFNPSGSASNQSYSERKVTASNVTVSLVGSKIVDYWPESYALRLYRTALNNDGTETSLSDAIMKLVPNMNSKGFMVVEFGMSEPNKVDNLPVKQDITNDLSATLTGVTLNGTQKGNTTLGIRYSFDAPTLSNVNWTTATYNGKTVPIDDLYTLVADNVWTGGKQTTSYSTTTIEAGEAWAIAVQSFLNRLSNATFTTNDGETSTILYTDEITPNTTIADVQGHVIVKVNTNSTDDAPDNETVGWVGTRIPALFSRWVGNSRSEARTINLKWGCPTKEPTPLLVGDYDLHWCYTEEDNINKLYNSVAGTIQMRKDAIDDFAETSAKNYLEGKHRTFYECAIGGYLNDNPTAENYQTAAKNLNPYLLKKLQDPTRASAPFGFVFMSYAIPPAGQEEDFKSAELISTIINNNVAFLLQRKGDESSTTKASDKTNSSFVSKNGNPFK